MKPLTVFAGFVFAAMSSTVFAQPLAWNDPSIRDGDCSNSQPPPLRNLDVILNTLASLPQGFQVFLPYGNQAYYRWLYQKANGGVAATSQAQILSTQPRLTFPYPLALLNLAAGKVDIFDQFPPTTKWYELQPFPLNPFGTKLTVNIVNPSPGSAPYGFGGENIPTRFIWADQSALVEWHCFEGGIPVVNIISLSPVLTSQQISAISTFLQGYGFQLANLMTMPY